MIQAQFRPIDQWPAPFTDPRTSHVFKASYPNTLDLLEFELGQLSARDVVIQLALDLKDIRNDGWPRSGAKPDHPGIIVAFDSVHGPLKYATDQFYSSWNHQMEGWQANLRAIALGLEALRKVDRYGISRRGEQYTGWSALPPGAAIEAGPAPMTALEAYAFLDEWSGGIPLQNKMDIHRAYLTAAKRLHPDVGGDPELFKRLVAATEFLLGGAS